RPQHPAFDGLAVEPDRRAGARPARDVPVSRVDHPLAGEGLELLDAEQPCELIGAQVRSRLYAPIGKRHTCTSRTDPDDGRVYGSIAPLTEVGTLATRHGGAMRVESSGAFFDVRRAPVNQQSVSSTAVVQAADGTLLVSCRLGTDREGPDGHAAIFASRDLGASWELRYLGLGDREWDGIRGEARAWLIAETVPGDLRASRRTRPRRSDVLLGPASRRPSRYGRARRDVLDARRRDRDGSRRPHRMGNTGRPFLDFPGADRPGGAALPARGGRRRPPRRPVLASGSAGRRPGRPQPGLRADMGCVDRDDYLRQPRGRRAGHRRAPRPTGLL